MMINIIFGMLILGMLLAFFRLLRGPSLPDRVVALDVLAIQAVGMIAAHAVRSNQSIYLDVALALALITFLSTIAFAFHIEKGELPWKKS
ncbi:MAG: cation:proton antiporter [Anaerolineaceae bacterium]|nr:cation:proton antiporter [Anaerolineaceae bacterium]